MKRAAEKWNLSDISQPLTNQHTITMFYCSLWKNETVLIGQSGSIGSLLHFFHQYTVKKSEILHWSERSTRTVATKSSKWQELDLESCIFSPILYNVPRMTSRTTERRSSCKQISPVSQPLPNTQNKSARSCCVSLGYARGHYSS